MLKPETELEKEIVTLIQAPHLSEEKRVELVLMRLRMHNHVIEQAKTLGYETERTRGFGWGNK